MLTFATLWDIFMLGIIPGFAIMAEQKYWDFVIISNVNINIRTRIVGGQWHHKITIYWNELSVYIHIWQFVTSQTVSFSHDIRWKFFWGRKLREFSEKSPKFVPHKNKSPFRKLKIIFATLEDIFMLGMIMSSHRWIWL